MARKKGQQPTEASKKQCGLCGKSGKLTKTPCCDNWICDDSHKYVIFSYARNSCFRNHDRYTLCGAHDHEQHEGRWQDCKKCKESFETEMYVWYGTNEYNFEKLKNPPKFKPTRCVKCDRIISLSKDDYSLGSEGYKCTSCSPHY